MRKWKCWRSGWERDFFRSHRGFLVNLREVYKYDATTIQMKNGDKVYLAKQKYNDFVTAYYEISEKRRMKRTAK